MAEFKSKFGIGDVVAKRDHVERWACGGTDDSYRQIMVSKVSFSGDKTIITFGTYEAEESNVISASDAKSYAVKFLSDRITKILSSEQK